MTLLFIINSMLEKSEFDFSRLVINSAETSDKNLGKKYKSKLAEKILKEDVDLDIELITPIAMEKELRFAIREGGHTVGAGVVTEIKA